MAETVLTKVIDIETGKSVSNIRDLKKEIRDLKSYLATLDQSSEQYEKTLQRLNQSEVQLNNLQKVSQQNTQQLANQLANLSKLGSGLAGGFSALNGLLSLLGKSGDDLSKTLVKLQSGIAIVQGIGGLRGLAESLPTIKNWFDGLRDSVSGFFEKLTPFDNRIKQSAEALNQLNITPGDINIQTSATGGKEITQVNQALGEQKKTIVPLNDQWTKYIDKQKVNLDNLTKNKTNLEAANKVVSDQIKEVNKAEKALSQYNQMVDEYFAKGGDLAEGQKQSKKVFESFGYSIEEANKLIAENGGSTNNLTKLQGELQTALKKNQVEIDNTTKAINKAEFAQSKLGIGLNNLKAALYSVGWTVAITTLVTLAYKVYDYAKSLNKAANAQREFDKAINESTAEISSKSVAAFNELLAVYDTFDDKTEFLTQYAEQIKQTGLKINDVTDAENAFVNNTENYKNAIIARAQIDAYRQKVSEKTREYIDKQLEVERKGAEDLQTALQNIAQYAPGTDPTTARIAQQAKTNKELKENEKEYNKFVNNIFNKTEELRKKWKPFWQVEDKEGNSSNVKVETDKDLETIKAFIKSSEELLRSDKDNALILLDEKYAGMLELAEKYGLDSTAIQEAYDKERYEITKKYNQLVIDDTEKANQKNWDDFQKELARIRNLSDTSNLRQPTEQQFTTRYAQKASRLVGGGFDRNEVFTYQSKEDIQNQYAAQIKYNNDLYNLTKQRIDQENALLTEQLNNDQLTADQRLEIERTLRENKIALSDAELKNEQDNAKAYDDVQSKKRQALQATLSVASSVAGSIASFAKTESENDKLSEKQRKAAFGTYKAAAISQAIMDTYAAANSSYQSMASIPYVGPFLGAAAAAAAIASGIANVRQILSTQMSSTSVNASTVTPPNIDTNVEYTRNLLGDKEIDEINKPTKVYVTEKDITDMQTKVKVKADNASF